MPNRRDREVDWPLVEGASVHRPVRQALKAGRLEQLVLLSHGVASNATLVKLTRQVLGVARAELQIERIALYAMGPSRQWFQGVIGTDTQGALVEEGALRHAVDPSDEALFVDCLRGHRAYEILEGAPLIAHRGDTTRVLGKGWLAKTPLVAEGRGFGIVYNDSALSGRRCDPLTQEMLVAFLTLVAPRLSKAWERHMSLSRHGQSALVASAMELMHAEPACSHGELAQRLGVSVRRLSAQFEREMGLSLVDARNSRRLQSFLQSVDEARHDGKEVILLDLALAAGFGSYAQFHRVFRGVFKQAPTDYLRRSPCARAR